MISFTALCFLMTLTHFLIVYYLSVVGKFSYKSMWLISSISSAAITIFVRRFTPFWQEKTLEVIKTGDVRPFTRDILTGLIILLAGGAASMVVIYQAYGAGATLFSTGTSAALAAATSV